MAPSAFISIKDTQGMIDLVLGTRAIPPEDVPPGVTAYQIRLFAWEMLRRSGTIVRKPEDTPDAG